MTPCEKQVFISVEKQSLGVTLRMMRKYKRKSVEGDKNSKMQKYAITLREKVRMHVYSNNILKINIYLY